VAVATEQRVDTGRFSGEPFGWHESGDRNGQVNVGRTERWLSMIAGGALAALALKRRTRTSGAAAIAGAELIYRGATGHCHLYQALGVNRAESLAFERGTGIIADRGSDTRRRLGGRRGIHVEESVTINRPIAEVYRFWRNFENLPKFMKHLEMVATREEGISHWVAKGPAGTSAEWDARIINEVENQVIGWRSLPGSDVVTAGAVNFDTAREGRSTQVSVHLQYAPPAGKAGALIASLFGREPSQTIREDLRHFKQLLEAGEMPRATA